MNSLAKHEWSVYLWRYTRYMVSWHTPFWSVTFDLVYHQWQWRETNWGCVFFIFSPVGVCICGRGTSTMCGINILMPPCLQGYSSARKHMTSAHLLKSPPPSSLMYTVHMIHTDTTPNTGLTACSFRTWMCGLQFGLDDGDDWILERIKHCAIYVKRCSSTQTALWHLKSTVCERERV